MDIENLSIAVNGVIWPGFLGETLPDWLADALEQGLAGVVYFSQNISSTTQVAQLSARIHEINPQAIVGTDEEGGTATRLPTGAGSVIPTAAMLGQIDDPAVTEAAGAVLAQLCQRCGVDLNLAPVADVNVAPENPVIGVRSFSPDPATVIRHTAAMVRGMQDGEDPVLACAKHFPGHGDTVTDSHHELPRVTTPLAEFTERHMPPFQAAVDAGVAAVMSAHIIIPELGELPATINPRVIRMLRETGFDGVVITDALDMAAIRSTVGSGEGAVQALLAGADLLCIGNPANPEDVQEGDTAPVRSAPDRDFREYAEVRDALLAAVRSGRIPEERIKEAQRRVLSLSESLQEKRLQAEQIRRQKKPTEQGKQQLTPGERIAQPSPESPLPDWLALTVQACTGAARLPQEVKNRGSIVINDLRDQQNLAVGALENFFVKILAEHVEVRLSEGNPAENADLILADALYPGSPQSTLLTELAAVNPHLICLNTGVEAEGIMPVPVLNCFGASQLSAQAAIRIILSD